MNPSSVQKLKFPNAADTPGQMIIDTLKAGTPSSCPQPPSSLSALVARAPDNAANCQWCPGIVYERQSPKGRSFQAERTRPLVGATRRHTAWTNVALRALSSVVVADGAPMCRTRLAALLCVLGNLALG
jgi:hypothetical protein